MFKKYHLIDLKGIFEKYINHLNILKILVNQITKSTYHLEESVILINR